MAAFPTLSYGKPDSRKFSESREDPALRSQIEGGYTASRPKHTRTPRRNFKVGYTSLSNEDKLLLDAHWDTQRGGSLGFTWVHPITNVSYFVRYKSDFDWSYVGYGDNLQWDCSFELEQI